MLNNSVVTLLFFNNAIRSKLLCVYTYLLNDYKTLYNSFYNPVSLFIYFLSYLCELNEGRAKHAEYSWKCNDELVRIAITLKLESNKILCELRITTSIVSIVN
jgi:hypothetical protein